MPDSVLHKAGPLTDEEFTTTKRHVLLGQSIVSGSGLEEEATWIRHHHERPDGGGYPDGLLGDGIPLESRMIFVADAFEAIVSDRPYRKGRSAAQALAELERNACTQFDPDCVAALRRVLSSGVAVEPAGEKLLVPA